MKTNWLQPDWEPGLSIPKVPIQKLLDKGLKGLILDVDGTLLSGKDVRVQNRVKNWVNEARKHMHIHLLSNNPSKKRVSDVAQQLNLSFTFAAGKPRRTALRKVLKKIPCNDKDIAIIGDRVFTDVLAGHRLGLFTVLVQPLEANEQHSKKSKVQELEKTIARLFGAFKK